MLSINDIRKLAEKTAKTLSENTEFVAEMGTYLAAREDVARGPVIMMYRLQSILGKDGMAALPRPGSEYKPGSNEPYDRYEEVTAGGKTVKGSFTNDLFNDLPQFGGAIAAKLADLALAKEGSKEAPAEYAIWSSDKIDRETKRLDAMRRNGRDALRRAINLWHKLNDVSALPGVNVKYAQNDDGTPDNSTTPIFIQSQAKPEKFKNFTVSAFLNLDIEYAKKTAVEKGGMWDALVTSGGNSNGRDNDDDDNGGDVSAWTTDVINTAVAKWAHFLEDKGSNAKLLKLVTEKDNDDFVESFGNAFHAWEAFYKAHVARKYTALQARKSAAQDKGAAA